MVKIAVGAVGGGGVGGVCMASSLRPFHPTLCLAVMVVGGGDLDENARACEHQGAAVLALIGEDLACRLVGEEEDPSGRGKAEKRGDGCSKPPNHHVRACAAGDRT